MSIEKRLKEDAARFSKLQPPANLRPRLQAELEALPPVCRPVQAARPVRKWFAPAIAMLSLVMILVLVLGIPEPDMFGTNGVRSLDTGTETDLTNGEMPWQEDNAESDRLPLGDARGKNLPWDRIGIFSGLAIITGFLCLKELKGRPKLLVPALAALVLFVTVGIISLLNI